MENKLKVLKLMENGTNYKLLWQHLLKTKN